MEKRTNRIKICVRLTPLIALAALGCSFGMAPQGMTSEETQKAFNAKSPQDQIAFIEHSPATDKEKKRQIDEIKKKYNLP